MVPETNHVQPSKKKTDLLIGGIYLKNSEKNMKLIPSVKLT